MIPVQPIATAVYIGLILVFTVIAAAVTYHLRRYVLRGDTTHYLMEAAFFVVSGILLVLATLFFLRIDWSLIAPSFL